MTHIHNYSFSDFSEEITFTDENEIPPNKPPAVIEAVVLEVIFSHVFDVRVYVRYLPYIIDGRLRLMNDTRMIDYLLW